MTDLLDSVATCPVHDFRPMRPEMLACPYELNRRLIAEAPVYQDPDSGIWFVSRYDDVVAMSMDHGTFSSVMPFTSNDAGRSAGNEDVAKVMAKGYPNVATMLTQDPPLQRRYRKFVDGTFSPRSLKALEPFIEQTSHMLIDQFIDSGQCDFLHDFGVPLPLRVIASQLGTPESDLHLLRKWTEAFIANLSQQLDHDGQVQAAKDMLEFQLYFVEKMEQRRQQPEDDILSKVVNASIDGDKPLDNAECLSMLSQILVAGNETTSSAFAEGILLLIRNPDQYEMVRRSPTAEMISNLVEEVLRVSSPSANMFRRTTKDVTLHGITIPKDSVCFARFGAANQDQERFADPLSFDITRSNLKDHVAFGKGVHHCLGAALSRREMNVGFKVVFERMQNFRQQAGSDEPAFAPNALLHGLTAMPLAFDKAS